jgi:DNA-binding PadR family transcriptional regulator
MGVGKRSPKARHGPRKRVALQSSTSAFHGYALAKVIKTTSGGQSLTPHGTLHRALQRLERAGLIESF